MIQRVVTTGISRGTGAILTLLFSVAIGRQLGPAGSGQLLLCPTVMILLLVSLGLSSVRAAPCVYLGASCLMALGSTVWVLMILRKSPGNIDSVGDTPGGWRYGFSATMTVVSSFLELWVPFLVLGRVAPDETRFISNDECGSIASNDSGPRNSSHRSSGNSFGH